MTVIALPSSPLYNAGSPYLVSQAQDLTSPMGGQTQRILRIGSRFGIDVAYPAMKYADGQAFLAAMMLSEGSPVSIVFPQRGFTVGTPGAGVVNGGGQSGNALALRGLTPGYVFSPFQFFHVTYATDGRRYLYCTTAGGTVSGGGAITLAIAPLIRNAPSDGDVLGITAPTMEGFIALQSKKIPWTIEMVRRLGVKFTVVEDR